MEEDISTVDIHDSVNWERAEKLLAEIPLNLESFQKWIGVSFLDHTEKGENDQLKYCPQYSTEKKKKNQLEGVNENSGTLAGRYYKLPPTTKVLRVIPVARKYSNNTAIIEMINLALKILKSKEPEDKIEKIRVAIQLLAMVGYVTRKVKAKTKDRGDFRKKVVDLCLIDIFGRNAGKITGTGEYGKVQTRDLLYHMIFKLVEAAGGCENLGWDIVDMRNVVPLSFIRNRKDLQQTAIFYTSLQFNRSFLDASTEIIRNLILSQIPTEKHVQHLLDRLDSHDSKLKIISAVNKTELRASKHVVSTFFLIMHGIDHVHLDCIDYAKFNRNNKGFKKLIDPNTGEQFKDKVGWDKYLDSLYNKVGHEVKSMLEILSSCDDNTVVLHCKAGRGRSVFVLMVFLLSNLNFFLQAVKKADTKNKKGTITVDDRVFLKKCVDSSEYLQENIARATDIIYSFVYKLRSQIDHQKVDKEAVQDCFMYLKKVSLTNKDAKRTSFSTANMIQELNQGEGGKGKQKVTDSSSESEDGNSIIISEETSGSSYNRHDKHDGDGNNNNQWDDHEEGEQSSSYEMTAPK